MKSITAISLAAITLAASSGLANAAVIITVTQVGSGVQIVGTGSIDLLSTIAAGTPVGVTSYTFNAWNGTSQIIGVFPLSAERYFLADFNVSGAASSNAFSGDVIGDSTLGVFVSDQSDGTLLVPVGYVSNDPLDFTASIENYDFTDYGLSVGDSIVVTWSNPATDTSDSLTMIFIPEPSTTLLFGAGVLSLAFRRRRI